MKEVERFVKTPEQGLTMFKVKETKNGVMIEIKVGKRIETVPAQFVIDAIRAQ